MKLQFFFVFWAAMIFSTLSQAQHLLHDEKENVHLLPDATSEDIIAYAQTHKVNISPTGDKANLSDVELALVYGQKNLNWLKAINSVRTEGQKLSMTNPNNRISYPISRPNKYNAEIISQNLNSLKSEMPRVMSEVIFGQAPVTEILPLPVEEYLVWARKADRVYQSAARWQLMQPYLGSYLSRAKNDLRGYYNLKQMTNLDKVLHSWATLSAEQKADLITWLINLCQNSGTMPAQCKFFLDKSIKDSQVLQFKNRYWSQSQKLYESYFKIQARQDDVRKGSNDIYRLTFQDPGSAELRSFLKINLEDEWKWQNWFFKIDFAPSANVQMQFEPGSTPHVNGIAGDIITMDQNTPLTEWEVSWTIRHEFGHVLGFPDCYIEFYSESEQAMVNYQLDTTNLMCSRAGNMKQILYDEMKRVYGQ